MKLFKRKRYYFSDSSVASDTIIAYIFGGVSLIIEITGAVSSVVTKGHIPDIIALLYICAFILSVSGLIFAGLGRKAQEGGEKGKRISVALNIIALAVPIAVVVFGSL